MIDKFFITKCIADMMQAYQAMDKAADQARAAGDPILWQKVRNLRVAIEELAQSLVKDEVAK